jgi:3-hydroxyacyl-CoA dehydrogenase
MGEIDFAMTTLGGFRMGPFRLMDFIGHDVNYAVTEIVWRENYFEPRYKPSITQKKLVEVKALETEAKQLATDAQKAPPAKKAQMVKTLAVVNARMKAATDALKAAQQQLNRARVAAQPRDIADIMVAEPFTIRVKPVEKK